MKPIIAVIMVKNEDAHIEAVIKGIEHFADDIIMIDTGSTDGTIAIAEQCGVKPFIEPDLKNTHSYVETYAGDNVWIFGVDGDEIYDSVGLKMLKGQMEEGMYEPAYQVQGWYLHVTDFTPGELKARGYLGPPSHTPTKLYNMSNISSWPNTHKDILFHVNTRIAKGLKMRAQPDTWEGTPMRCLHMRFLRRSSIEKEAEVGVRFGGRFYIGKRHGFAGPDPTKNYRYNYRRGMIHEVGIWNIEGANYAV